MNSAQRRPERARQHAQTLPPTVHHGWPTQYAIPRHGIWHTSDFAAMALGSGFNPHLPGFKHRFLATTLGATMWFFIFYRARYVSLHPSVSCSAHYRHRKDGAKLLVRSAGCREHTATDCPNRVSSIHGRATNMTTMAMKRGMESIISCIPHVKCRSYLLSLAIVSSGICTRNAEPSDAGRLVRLGI